MNEDAFTYIADSAFVTEENLAYFHNDANDDSPTLYFVTRLPFNYKEADRIVSEAVEANQWTDIGKINQTPATPKRCKMLMPLLHNGTCIGLCSLL